METFGNEIICDLDAIPDEESRSGPVPKGTYNCVVDQCVLKATKAGGQMIEVTYSIIEGEYKGMKIWDNHNVKHTNPRVVEIGLKGVKKLANAVGVTGKLASPSALADPQKIVSVSVEVRKDPNYGDSNVVKRVLGTTGTPQAASEPQQSSSSHVAPF